MKKECGNCSVWAESDWSTEENRTGQCQRYPPRVLLSTDGEEFSTFWPQVKGHRSCHEWMPTDVARFEMDLIGAQRMGFVKVVAGEHVMTAKGREVWKQASRNIYKREYGATFEERRK